MKLTQANAATIALPLGKSELIIRDAELTGFGLRIREGGSRHWVVQYRFGRKQRRVTLGSIKLLNEKQARKAAGEILARVRLGEDPQGRIQTTKAAATETFAVVAKRFLTRQERRLRASSYADAERYLMRHAKPLHRLTFADLDRKTIAARLETIASENGLVAADRFRAALSSLFTWAIQQGLCDTNPVIGTSRASEPVSRDRILSDAEIGRVWKALPANDFGHVVKLLFLTGARREEIAALRWSEIDREARLIVLPAERTKNHRAHEIPISDVAGEVLDECVPRLGRDLVFGARSGPFSGWSKAKRELDESLEGMQPWRIHDIRRTVATRCADLGTQPHIVEALLNHVSGSRSGVAGIYNRAAYTAEKREALEMWSDHLASVKG